MLSEKVIPDVALWSTRVEVNIIKAYSSKKKLEICFVTFGGGEWMELNYSYFILAKYEHIG